MKYKLICLDIDGTLLTDDKRLLPQVRQSIRKAAGRGARIALVSGRMPAGVDMLEEELGIPCIKICNAGTYILYKDRCIGAKYLSLTAMKRIYTEMAEKNNIPLWIFRDRQWYVTAIDRFIEREMEIVKYRPEVITVESLAQSWEMKGTGPSKMLLASEPENIQVLSRKMKEQEWDDIDFACSADNLLEIFPRGVTKATALSVICGKFHMKPEEIMAFGDQEMDIPMIEAAGLGIAMGNAIEALKVKSDFVTKSNNEAGIAYALEKYLDEEEI